MACLRYTYTLSGRAHSAWPVRQGDIILKPFLYDWQVECTQHGLFEISCLHTFCMTDRSSTLSMAYLGYHTYTLSVWLKDRAPSAWPVWVSALSPPPSLCCRHPWRQDSVGCITHPAPDGLLFPQTGSPMVWIGECNL